MLNKLLNKFRPGLLTRLSNIIIIQLVFIFLAITIIFLYPANINMKDNDYLALKDKYAHVGQQISKAIKISSSKSNDIAIDDNLKKNMGALLNRERINYLYLFVQNKNKEIKTVLTLNSSSKNYDDDKINAMQELIDQGIISYEMRQNGDNLIPVVPETHFAVYYYRFNINKRMPAVLVSFVDNKYLVSNRPQTLYALLILFLSSALVSLLLIYLLNKRFQEPLKHLIMGLEKTAAGELYYLMESNNDEELNKLTAAFNNMSKTLWDDHKKLKRYNLRLKDAYMMLKESQKFLKTLIDSSPSCIISALDNGEINSFNKKAVEIFGINSKEAIGKNINNLFTHPINKMKSNKKENSDEKGIEILCRRGDGSLFPAFVNIAPIVNSDEQISAYLYIIKDISESKSFQEMMIRIDRYYTRGEMAGDIAHEINNFLAILSGNVELIPLFIKKGDQEKIEKKLALMKTTIDKIARFTDGLMDSNSDEIRFDKVDINQLIETILAFLKPQNKFDEDEIITHLSTETPLVELDISQIQQVMVNLVNNASEALEEKESEKIINIYTEFISDPYGNNKISIRVHDNGPGVITDKVPLLFKKRFTTKRKGHGIGLITCKRIIDAHNGSISYQFNQGADFSFEIPVSRKEDLSNQSDTEQTQAKVSAV